MHCPILVHFFLTNFLTYLLSNFFDKFFDNFFFQFYRQKLRGAVYDALSNLGVTETSPLFKPAFKKLFDIVSVYAKDMPKNTASTKQWLGVVAKQNATTVINLERALRTK